MAQNRIHIIPQAEHSYDILVITSEDGSAFIGIGDYDAYLEQKVFVELTDWERQLIVKALQKPSLEKSNG